MSYEVTESTREITQPCLFGTVYLRQSHPSKTGLPGSPPLTRSPRGLVNRQPRSAISREGAHSIMPLARRDGPKKRPHPSSPPHSLQLPPPQPPQMRYGRLRTNSYSISAPAPDPREEEEEDGDDEDLTDEELSLDELRRERELYLEALVRKQIVRYRAHAFSALSHYTLYPLGPLPPH
jgi:hypothetical protein